MHSTFEPRALTLAELAARTGATLAGPADIVVSRVATLENAGPGAITFFTNARYRAKLATTRASAVIVAPDDAAATPLPKLVSSNPYATYARVASILHPADPTAPGIHSTAVVDPTARVAPSAAVGAFAVIGARAIIGERANLGAHAVVGADAEVGEDAVLDAHVTLYPRCVVGARTLIHSGVVIGGDGFGLAQERGRWQKIPQVGRAVIGADVEIGANTTIDRGAIDDTVIEDGVKLDNQIQVGHNCVIGAHTAVAGCVGIAGSTRIGRGCRIGGAAMISGHLQIADGVVISAATQVYDSIREPGTYTGAFPALPHRQWKQVASETRRLRELADRVRMLEKALVATRADADAAKGRLR